MGNYNVSQVSAKELASMPLRSLNLSSCPLVDDEFLMILSQSSTLLKLQLDFCFGAAGLGFTYLCKVGLEQLSM
jgi:hypothetical protein